MRPKQLLKNSITKLEGFRKESDASQRQKRLQIEDVFLDFWATNPSFEEFKKYTRGLRLTPIMIYAMVKGYSDEE